MYFGVFFKKKQFFWIFFAKCFGGKEKGCIFAVSKGNNLSDTLKWWIHLRARIHASHAWHRGSNPLSTPKRATKVARFFCLYQIRSRCLVLCQKFGISRKFWWGCRKVTQKFWTYPENLELYSALYNPYSRNQLA